MHHLSKFAELAEMAADWKLTELFEKDLKRAETFTFSHAGIHLDLSKQFILKETLSEFVKLAEKLKFSERITALFNRQRVNITENRPALHWLLRTPTGGSDHPESKEIQTALAQMARFTRQIHSGSWKNEFGEPITDIVNLGVGGSDLGPRMCTRALKHWDKGKTKVHFISNIDGEDISRCMKDLNPKITLFIVTSKSFGTSETLQNAHTAQAWLRKSGIKHMEKHFIAVSSNIEKAEAFGINRGQIFPMWDWVGGRYSLWSAAGLSIMLTIGEQQFLELLSGAHAMDRHFQNEDLSKNLPFLLAAISLYNTNGFKYQTQAVIPYDEALSFLPNYLQQLAMESNGKSVQINDSPVDYCTSPVLWGGVGTNSQHSFHQLMHQGKIICPVDFLLPLKPNHELKDHHRSLVANCLAQSQALMVGRPVIKQGSKMPDMHKEIPGNKPSTLIIYEQMKPDILGALIALYEHKTYAESLFWNINAFDQWGVELGKQLARPIIQALKGGLISPKNNHPSSESSDLNIDTSTLQWIKAYQASNE